MSSKISFKQLGQDIISHFFSGDYKDLKNKPTTLPNPQPITFGGYLPNKSYNGSQALTIEFPDMEIVNESAGTPVGEIISFMGKTAPANYLICDGTVYNVTDYPYLAQHFQDTFGSKNYFGGNGVDTFAVPDLRGEFLRGSGTASRDTGSGGGVGEHQDGTIHMYMSVYNRIPSISVKNNNSSGNNNPPNIHNTIDKVTGFRKYLANLNANTTSCDDGGIAMYTSRPTNTSVLYCIKCQPTHFSTPSCTYSYQERKIGTWVNGKPLYQKTVDFGSLPIKSGKEVAHSIANIDMIWIYDGCIINHDDPKSYWPLQITLEWDKSGSTINVDKTCIHMSTNWGITNLTAMITLRYVKTTD